MPSFSRNNAFLASLKPFLRPSGGGGTTYINSIQQVSITISASSTSNTATITSVGSGAFIIFQGTTTTDSNSADIPSVFTRVTLTNSTTVTATRGGSTSAVTVNCVVIDPTASLVSSVQFGTVSVTSTNTSNTATISSVTTSRSAVFYLGSSGSNGIFQSRGLQFGVTLTNSTTVTAIRGATDSETNTISFCVVQFAAAAINSVQQLASVYTAQSGTAQTVTITSVNTSNSFIAFGGVNSNSNTYAAAYNTAALTNSTTVTYNRNTGSGINFSIYCTVIEFVSGVLNSAQRGTIALSAQTSNTATITSVNTSKAFGNYLGWLTSGSNPDACWGKISLTNGTTVTGTVNTSGTLTLGYEAIEFTA